MMRNEKNFDTATVNNTDNKYDMTGYDLMGRKKRALIGLALSALHLPVMLLTDHISEAVNPGVGLGISTSGFWIAMGIILMVILAIGGALKEFIFDVISVAKVIISISFGFGFIIGLPLAFSLGIGVPLMIVFFSMFLPVFYMLIHYIRVRAEIKEAEGALA